MSAARRQISDWILVCSVAGGLYSPYALTLLLPAVLIRGQWADMEWRIENKLMLLAAGWALGVAAFRGDISESNGVLPHFLFLWSLPHIMIAFKPDVSTQRRFNAFLILIFAIDLIFNIATLITGDDIFGRALDLREGTVGGRLGGIFAHSFYSGSISLAALLTFLAWRQKTWFAIFPAANMIMAGSWRFAMAVFIVALLATKWEKRSRISDSLIILAFSLSITIGVALTSSYFESYFGTNPSNDLRVFAWVTSIEKIATSPFLGIGYPNVKAIQDFGVSFQAMEDNLIAESWYLDSAITFGIPYTILFLSSLVAAFYGKKFTKRTKLQAMLYPLLLIDLTYGSIFGSVLIYSWLWITITSTPKRVESNNSEIIKNDNQY